MENKWNRLCEIFKKNYNEREEKVQKVVEQIFSVLFGYDPFEEEIDSHRVLHIGSIDRLIPDIIIRDSSRNKDLFIVELKQLNMRPERKYEEQLISYMRLLSLNIGILICDAIYVYILDDNTPKFSKIELFAENKKGEAFIETFSKGNFSAERVKNFILAEQKFNENVTKIRNEITENNVLQLIKNHFETLYSKDEVDAAISDMTIYLIPKEKSASPFMKQPNQDIKISSPSSDPMIYDEPKFEYVIIKTRETTVMERGSLYEATRYKWVASARITQYSFVLSVINGIVKQVYIVDRWSKCGSRWEFFGREAEGEEFESLIGKKIPQKYRKKGMASPVVYKKAND